MTGMRREDITRNARARAAGDESERDFCSVLILSSGVGNQVDVHELLRFETLGREGIKDGREVWQRGRRGGRVCHCDDSPESVLDLSLMSTL